MNIIHKHVGDLLSMERGIIVHGCNCQGVMGAGVALAVKKKYPVAYEHYRQEWQDKGLYLGSINVVSGVPTRSEVYLPFRISLPPELVIVNGMTQNDYKREPGKPDVDYDAIFSVFAQVRMIAKIYNLPVHFPLIGCGLAGGDWNIVEPLIMQALGEKVEKHLWVLK